MLRWIVDRKRRKEVAHHELSEEELAADADRSPGVLCASGYIAGGAIAGIVIAVLAGVFDRQRLRLLRRLPAGVPFD